MRGPPPRGPPPGRPRTTQDYTPGAALGGTPDPGGWAPEATTRSLCLRDATARMGRSVPGDGVSRRRSDARRVPRGPFRSGGGPPRAAGFRPRDAPGRGRPGEGALRRGDGGAGAPRLPRRAEEVPPLPRGVPGGRPRAPHGGGGAQRRELPPRDRGGPPRRPLAEPHRRRADGRRLPDRPAGQVPPPRRGPAEGVLAASRSTTSTSRTSTCGASTSRPRRRASTRAAAPGPMPGADEPKPQAQARAARVLDGARLPRRGPAAPGDGRPRDGLPVAEVPEGERRPLDLLREEGRPRDGRHGDRHDRSPRRRRPRVRPRVRRAPRRVRRSTPGAARGHLVETPPNSHGAARIAPPWQHFLDAKVPEVGVFDGGATYHRACGGPRRRAR